MTQRLKTLPYNCWSTEKPLFPALLPPCFPDCWKVSLVVLVFKTVEQRSTKTLGKVFEKLVNYRIVDYLEKSALFYCHYGFSSSRSTSDLLTVASDRISRAFNRYGTTGALAFDISQPFDRVWHASLLHKLKSYGILG